MLSVACLCACVSHVCVADSATLVEAMYIDLETQVLHVGVPSQMLLIRRGVKQGCPMSGNLKALAAGPWVHSYMARMR